MAMRQLSTRVQMKWFKAIIGNRYAIKNNRLIICWWLNATVGLFFGRQFLLLEEAGFPSDYSSRDT